MIAESKAQEDAQRINEAISVDKERSVELATLRGDLGAANSSVDHLRAQLNDALKRLKVGQSVSE